jgi:ferredoxin
MSDQKTVNLTIDGRPVTVPEGTRILEAAQKVNIRIPVLCEHPDLCKRDVRRGREYGYLLFGRLPEFWCLQVR